MIFVIDVDYREDKTVAAGVLFQNWTDAEPLQEVVVSCNCADDYVPGQFYRRELPCIEKLLEQTGMELDFIVIDGYVYLGEDRKPGSGKHLSGLLQQSIVVIGVAKNPFKNTPASAELLRGKSLRPLYVTAEGIEEEKAKRFIQQMHGEGRIPTLLKRVDQLCRKV